MLFIKVSIAINGEFTFLYFVLLTVSVLVQTVFMVVQTVSTLEETVSTLEQTVSTIVQTVSTLVQTVSAFLQTVFALPHTVSAHLQTPGIVNTDIGSSIYQNKSTSPPVIMAQKTNECWKVAPKGRFRSFKSTTLSICHLVTAL